MAAEWLNADKGGQGKVSRQAADEWREPGNVVEGGPPACRTAVSMTTGNPDPNLLPTPTPQGTTGATLSRMMAYRGHIGIAGNQTAGWDQMGATTRGAVAKNGGDDCARGEKYVGDGVRRREQQGWVQG